MVSGKARNEWIEHDTLVRNDGFFAMKRKRILGVRKRTEKGEKHTDTQKGWRGLKNPDRDRGGRWGEAEATERETRERVRVRVTVWHCARADLGGHIQMGTTAPKVPNHIIFGGAVLGHPSPATTADLL